jgi:hypothetical protein
MERSRWLSAVASLAVVCGLLLGPGAGGGQAAPQPTAAQLLHTALADAAARGSVHQTLSEVFGTRRATYSDDVSTSSGRQAITASGGIQAHVLVLAHVAYISGNEAGLVSYFGFPAAIAKRVGNRWVSVPSSTGAYATVSAAATLSSALADITPSGQLTTTAPTTIAGQAVVGIRGRPPASLRQTGTATIYVTRSSHPLPVYVTITLANAAGTVTSTLSNWGERVAITAPANAIPASRLG